MAGDVWTPSAWLSLPQALPAEITTFTIEEFVRRTRAPLPRHSRVARIDYLRALADLLLAGGLITDTESDCNDNDDTRAAFLAIELATREQACCDLWHLLRRSLATASVIRWGPQGPSCQFHLGAVRETQSGQTDAMEFGCANEPLARGLVGLLCVPLSDVTTPDGIDGPGAGAGKEENYFVFESSPDSTTVGDPYRCGLLIDLRTGAVGASLDMLVCDRDTHDRLAPHRTQDTLRFFEIKCRAKYIFDLNSGTPLELAYHALLRRRTTAALRDFLQAVRHPAITYFAEDALPPPDEALVTCDVTWRPARYTTSVRRCPDLDRHHLALNACAKSRVWLFNEPDDRDGSITPARWRETEDAALYIPAFANPRHANFKQILVQKYVLSSYFPDRELQPFLVTFIGRRRHPAEYSAALHVCYPNSADGQAARTCRVPSTCAVPVLLLVTPVTIDDEHIWDTLRTTAADAFAAAADLLWASSSPADPGAQTTAF